MDGRRFLRCSHGSPPCYAAAHATALSILIPDIYHTYNIDALLVRASVIWTLEPYLDINHWYYDLLIGPWVRSALLHFKLQNHNNATTTTTRPRRPHLPSFPCHAHLLPSLFMGLKYSMLIAHRSLLFLHHYSYNISCLSSRLANKQARRFLLACLPRSVLKTCLLACWPPEPEACLLLAWLLDMIWFLLIHIGRLQRYVGNKVTYAPVRWATRCICPKTYSSSLLQPSDVLSLFRSSSWMSTGPDDLNPTAK